MIPRDWLVFENEPRGGKFGCDNAVKRAITDQDGKSAADMGKVEISYSKPPKIN
ncbi:hypothetical protein [Sphingobium sp. Sx8-8]|uniref:hypothetical protein n=1 Tax=Sphingobium sp. Sx8-8 TaxID=2933617 RepID=UPI001F5A5301|nr:hypothetical protein [Sphingobium sp. Sx8-8]